MLKKRRRSRAFKRDSQVVNIEEAREKRRAKRKSADHAKKSARLPQEDEKFYESEGTIAQRKKMRKKRKRCVYFAVLLCFALLIGVSIINIFSLQAEKNKVKEENKMLTTQKSRLEQQLKEVNTPEYIEDQARAHLRLVRPGEILYILPEDDNSGDADKSSDTKQKETDQNEE